jgi:hypothetical protein
MRGSAPRRCLLPETRTLQSLKESTTEARAEIDLRVGRREQGDEDIEQDYSRDEVPADAPGKTSDLGKTSENGKTHK